MSEVPFVVGGADPGLRERLDEEISAFNATARRATRTVTTTSTW